MEYLEDMDNSYTFEMQTAYSPLGNNQFNEYPMSLKRQNVCDFLNTTYREYQQYWKDGTDWIQVGPEGLCPWPKGIYTFYDYLYTDTIPIPPVIPSGLWRQTILFKGPNRQKAVIRFYTKVWYR
ncbi:uncharacterized protein LOC129759085 [Uranotaenia lowii]|nr:uncharacterized protein LOC129759085 [Uranotaenia lowii]